MHNLRPLGKHRGRRLGRNGREFPRHRVTLSGEEVEVFGAQITVGEWQTVPLGPCSARYSKSAADLPTPPLSGNHRMTTCHCTRVHDEPGCVTSLPSRQLEALVYERWFDAENN